MTGAVDDPLFVGSDGLVRVSVVLIAQLAADPRYRVYYETSAAALKRIAALATTTQGGKHRDFLLLAEFLDKPAEYLATVQYLSDVAGDQAFAETLWRRAFELREQVSQRIQDPVLDELLGGGDSSS